MNGRIVLVIAMSCAACGGKAATKSTSTAAPDPSKEVFGQACADKMLTYPETDESAYGPLEAGADYASYRKVTTQPYRSRTHGGRWVEVYVNDVGYDAYVGEAPFPVGSTIVKTSWEDDGGKPGAKAGPIFVMRKEAAGYLPDHEDWNYGIHWDDPTPDQLKRLGGPVYWRGQSPKVSYCYKCHDNYDRAIGGVPVGSRAWEQSE